MRFANTEDEKELSAIANDEKTEVVLGGKKIKIGWLKRATLRQFSSIMVSEKDESQVSCKLAATIRLNGYFKLKLFYPLVWRWYYYIKQYDDKELLPLITEGKKKVQLQEYWLIMMLSQDLRDTLQTMTREEANRMLQEQLSERKAR